MVNLISDFSPPVVLQETAEGCRVLAPGVVSQLVGLAGVEFPGEMGSNGVRVDAWLEWLIDAYTESKKNAITLYEALYAR